jgi:hypothetical protein
VRKAQVLRQWWRSDPWNVSGEFYCNIATGNSPHVERDYLSFVIDTFSAWVWYLVDLYQAKLRTTNTTSIISKSPDAIHGFL